MRVLAILLGLGLAGISSADLVGQWQGIATLGPSNVAQGMDGDSLIKLQISKGFLKTLNYQFAFKADKTFVSSVQGEDIPPRKGKGTWVASGNLVTITFMTENGQKRNQVLKGSLTPDGKKLVLSIDSKPGLPQTKLVFKKLEPAGAAKPKSKPAKSTGH